MRVLLITPLFPPDKGGAAMDFSYLSRIFAQNENVSDIFVLSGWKKAKKLCRVNGKMTHLKILNYGNCLNPVYRLIWNTLIIREIIAKYRPHIIIFHSVILPFREYYPELFKDIGDAALYLYKTDLFPVPGFPKLKGIVYISKSIKTMLRQQEEIPPGKLIYIPLLFKPPRHRGGNRTETVYPFRYILYIGSANPLKGLHQLIKAFSLLEKAHEEVKLIVIGAGADGVSYRDGIIFLEEQGRGSVYEHIKHAAVVVISSFSEGLPRVALETLYLKRPLIITGVVEETRHLHPNQILQGHEPGEIAGKINAILGGEPYKTEFDWDNLRFDKSKETWNKLIDEAAPDVPRIDTMDYSPLIGAVEAFQNRKEHSDLTGENPLHRIAALTKKCYTAVMTARDFSQIPHGVLNVLPGLETIPYIYFPKIPDEKNWESLIDTVYNNPFLMSYEKKGILKTLLTGVLERFHTGMDPGKTCRMFDSLTPLTALDFLYLGAYFKKRREFKAAEQMFYRGLDYLPEIAHFKLFYHLLASIPPEFRGSEQKQEALVKRFKSYLRRIPFSGLVKELNNTTVEFLEFYTDIKKQLKKEMDHKEMIHEKHIDFQFKIHLLAGDDKNAYEILDKKRNKKPLDIYTIASFHKKQGNYRKAVRGFERVVREDCDVDMSVGAYYHLGKMAFDRKQYPEARQKFESCLALNPMHRKAVGYLDLIGDAPKNRGVPAHHRGKKPTKKLFLLHDPVTIGHHLIYAENFIDWALALGFRVMFSSIDLTGTALYRKYSTGKDAGNVEFVPFDVPGDHIHRFHTGPGGRLQVNHILELQKKFKPDITFFQNGDYMWLEWNRMLMEGMWFPAPTYMLLIRGNEAFYLDEETFYSLSLGRQIGKELLFNGIMTLDEYQVKSGIPHKNFYYLPDPFMPMDEEEQPFAPGEAEILNRILQFLEQTEGKTVVLFMGLVAGRKNFSWLLEATYRRPECCYVQLGTWQGEKRIDEKSSEIISQLINENRYLAVEEFLPFRLLSRVLKSHRIKFMLLPYENHYGSSGIQLMALNYLKPVLVPEHGLMGRRVKDNGLGMVFENGNREDFFRKVAIIMRQDPLDYEDNIRTFMEKFSKQSLFRSLDNVFLSSQGIKS